MKDIKKYLDEERDGNYSFYFEDLDGSYTYAYNHQVKKTSAGTMKLMLAAVFLKKVEEDLFSLDELVVINEKDKKPGSGILADFIERPYTIRELIVSMLIIGDNTSANKLMQLLGVKQINEMFRDMGLKNTTISEEPGSEVNLTTAEDLALTLKALYNRTYLNDTNSEFIIELLRRRVKSKIRLYLPSSYQYQISSKTGDGLGIENEAAIINNESGNFVFTIMASELPNSVYGLISLAKAGMLMRNTIEEDWNPEGLA